MINRIRPYTIRKGLCRYLRQDSPPAAVKSTFVKKTYPEATQESTEFGSRVLNLTSNYPMVHVITKTLVVTMKVVNWHVVHLVLAVIGLACSFIFVSTFNVVMDWLVPHDYYSSPVVIPDLKVRMAELKEIGDMIKEKFREMELEILESKSDDQKARLAELKAKKDLIKKDFLAVKSDLLTTKSGDELVADTILTLVKALAALG